MSIHYRNFIIITGSAGVLLNFGWWFMLSQVAKLFLFRNWFAIIDLWSINLLETGWQLVQVRIRVSFVIFDTFFASG